MIMVLGPVRKKSDKSGGKADRESEDSTEVDELLTAGISDEDLGEVEDFDAEADEE